MPSIVLALRMALSYSSLRWEAERMPVSTGRTFQVGYLVQGQAERPGNAQLSVPQSPTSGAQGCWRTLPPLAPYSQGIWAVASTGAHCQPNHILLPSGRASSNCRSQTRLLPQNLQEATWERKGVLESHVLPGREEEVPGRQSLQGGLGGAGLSLPRKEERRSPN